METILFLHGWGGNKKSFAPIESFFRANFKCIFVSFPCFLKSDKNSPAEPWTLDDYADFVLKTLDDKKVSKCHVVAHSFGARVAVILADRYPQRFLKLVLTGPAGIPRRFNLFLKIKILLHKLKIKQSRGSVDYRCLSDVGKITFQNVIKRDLCPEIARITQPVLVIWGRKDKAIRRYMIKMWTNLCLNIKLVTYKKSGHFCYIDEPTRFIIDTQDFLFHCDAK